jgi:NitT/TauT family transport system permease protein
MSAPALTQARTLDRHEAAARAAEAGSDDGPAAPWLAFVAVAAALAVAGYTRWAPQRRAWPGTPTVAVAEATAAGVLLGVTFLAQAGSARAVDARAGRLSRGARAVRDRLVSGGPWLVAIPLWLAVWEASTAKLHVLPLPWFPPPASVVQVYVDDWPTLLQSTLYSARLLLLGAAIGAVSGFVTGVAIAWWRSVGYWVHPVLKLIGPVPATAWLPIVFVVFPTSFSASVFLVSLAAWFPVTVLTWSGVASVKAGYYDVARTLGAGQAFLVRKVAVPAALPHVFVGLFMGLGSTFVTLIVAEMLGVKAGLGWYIQWAIGWAAYNKMYAALIVMALLFSGLLGVVFAVRDHFLDWQKGLLRW